MTLINRKLGHSFGPRGNVELELQFYVAAPRYL